MSPIFGALRLPASVIFGSGQRAAIGMMTAQIGKRALICTDARLGGDAQFKAIVSDIQANGVETKVYDRTEADLPINGISACVAECADFKPDVVLGIGGGSCMDMAKCVAVLLQHGGSLRDYYGENKIPGPVAPVIAVPTTSGTGSEVTPVAVIADTERGTKVGISSPYLIPRVAVCDPEMTVSCPPSLTAVSGADALTHAIESYTAASRTVTPDLIVKNVFVGKNVLSDTFGLLALTNIFKALRTAVKDGKNIEAREQMMLASLAAGCAFGAAGTFPSAAMAAGTALRRRRSQSHISEKRALGIRTKVAQRHRRCTPLDCRGLDQGADAATRDRAAPDRCRYYRALYARDEFAFRHVAAPSGHGLDPCLRPQDRGPVAPRRRDRR